MWILVIGVTLAAELGILLIPLAADAAFTPPIPFGGRIKKVTFCNEGVWLIVGTPRPGSFVFTPLSLLFAWYSIFFPGPWVLGIADAEVAVTCTQGKILRGAGLKIIMIGTSAIDPKAGLGIGGVL